MPRSGAEFTTVGSAALPAVPWAKLLNGDVLVRALVVSDSDDRQLIDLRQSFVVGMHKSAQNVEIVRTVLSLGAR